MTCPACAHENRPGAKFCRECASPLPRACASCGAALAPGSKFCDECGAAAGAAVAPKPSESSDARKVVTIVFADLVGSTALHERLEPESARRFMEGYYAAMRGAVESHGGTVTQFLGDGVKAVFGMPRVAEDDAIRAVRAAVAMQAAFRALADPQREAIGKTGLRVAVNTGEVVANDATEIIGDPVNVAARLQEQGRDGDVVVGESTHRLVATLVTLELLGSFALKGRSEAVKAYRVISLERPAGAAASPFVGRDDELARISAVYETAVSKPATALAVLLGSPGLGKSRLIDELAQRLGGGATVIRAHCDPSGGASFAPLADALRARPDLDAALPGTDAERARILDGVRALLAGSPAAPEETFFVVRRLLAALAAAKPVLLVIDDLHWAEPLLLDLVEHLVQWGSGVPLLVLVGARPELREMRSSLTIPGGLVSEVISLAGLDAGAAMRLAANVIGAADLPASVAAKVLATSEGNPLFVGELVRMLVHEGALKKEGERWTAGTALAALEMPPTIHALLAARIERLRPEERNVLERAAVIGRHFSRSAVADLLARDATDLDARLESLRRADLIERDSGWFFGEPGLRFHHVLIRDAAYRRILKGTRAELHARFADWTLARAGDSIEHDETIGWHLEQAHQFLRELGPIDARGRALGERAAARLSAAGRRALARDDVSLAAGLLGRALDHLDRDDAARAELALDWCEALLAAGDVGPAAAALEELDRFAANDPRLRAWHTCFAGQLTSLTAPEGLNAAAEAVAIAASELAALGDVAGEAKAHFVHAQAFMRLGRVGACEASLDRALAAARRLDDRRRANTVLAVAPLAALWGPSPVTRASGRCLDVVRVLRITQGAPAVEAVALSCQGLLEALRGRTDAARRMIGSARKMVEELGITQRLLEADVFTARIDLLDGDAASAERGLRAAYDGMRGLGLGIDAARAAALLARALLQLDRAEEAEAFTRESEQLAGDDLQAAIAWRGARAEALARRGETVEAVALASKAVEIAAATDALLDHADARLALAAALRASGHTREADAEERRATELWEAKGATLLAERARRESPRPSAALPQPEGQPEAPAAAPRSARRRVRSIGLSANGAAFEAATAARDIGALERVFSDPCVVVHHPTGVTYGRREQLSSWKSMFRAEHLTYRREVLATLGDSLELWRHWISVSGLGGEAYESFGLANFEEIVLGEDDGHGRYRGFEIFDASKLGDAIARLYERHAELPLDDREHARAVGVARTARVMLGQPDLAATSTVLAPDVEFSDLRTVGFGTLHGAERVLQTIAAMLNLSRDDSARIDDVLALSPDALVVRWTNRGTHGESGGAFERNLCQLFTFDVAGKLACWQQFETEHDAAALARLDALAGSGAAEEPENPFENAASRADRALICCFNARDWNGVLALIAPRLAFDERRRLTRNVADREVWLEQFRFMFDVPERLFTIRLLATRGERLSLHRHEFDGLVAGGGGPFAMDPHLTLHEVDRDGRIVAIVLFDLEDEEAARAELDARYDAGEGAAHSRILAAWYRRERAFAIRDWDDLSASYTGRVFRDHRLLGWGTTPTRDWVSADQIMRSLVDLAPDVQRRHDHVRLCERGLLAQTAQVGTRDGGAFEIVFLAVYEWDAQGRLQTIDNYDVDRFDLALARFEELATVAEFRPVFENAASRAFGRGNAATAARDWEGFGALFAPEFRSFDRRAMVQLEADREQWLASYRQIVELTSTLPAHELLATRGDRLALVRVLWRGGDGDIGPSEIDVLLIIEVDGHGNHVRVVTFDADDLDAAWAELDARFVAGEGTAHPNALAAWLAARRALDARDWDAFRIGYAPLVVCHDHRLLGWGILHGVAAFVRTQQVLIELAPDTRWRVDQVALCERGSFQSSLLFGTRDGGPFELPFLRVTELDERGKVHRIDLYDLDQVDRARARFAEIATPARAESPFANAASRSLERNARCWAARDWEGALAILSPTLRFDDRRRMMRLEIGYQDFVAQFRMLFDQPGSRWHESLLATRGERLALTRTRFEAEVAGGGGPLAFDDHLSLTEVDADGRWIGAVTFDLDDADSAFAELDARFDRGEATLHPEVWAAQKARSRASRDGDSDAFSAYCAPSSVSMDHRSLGFPSGTADQQFQRVRAMYDLAPDARARRYHIRMSSRGLLFVVTWHGTRDGAAFEIPLINVDEVDAQGLVRRHDGYAPEQIDLALARFAELQAPVAPPAPFANAASRALDRGMASWRVRDWEGYEQDLSPDYRFLDRRKPVQLELDRPQAIQYARESGDMAVTHVGGRLLATRGDRLSLSQVSTELSDESVGPSRIDSLNLTETDERGALLYSARFDPDALDAAYAELDARFEAGEGAHNRASEVMRAFARAFQDRDWQAMRALLSPSLVCHDHRLLGWGTLHGAEAFVATQRTLTELAPDTRYRFDHIRVAERATLHEALGFGTRDGGAYELPFLRVTEFDAQGLIARFDFYDVDRIDEARPRFDELLAVATPPPVRFANAATRNVDGGTAALSARDWQGFGAFFAPGFRNYDRRAMVRLEAGREQFLASYRQIVEMTSSPPTREVVATRGDRLALVRIRWLGADGDVGPSEIDWLLVVEVDGRGDQIAGVAFDEDDLDAAYAELDARFDAGEGTAHLLAAAWLAGYLCGFAARDWDSMTALLAPDLIGHNHRLVGWGTLHGPKALVSTMRAQVELAPDTQERVDHVRTCERGVLFEYAWHGTYEGGAFENVWIVVIELDALGRARRADVFEAEQLDQAQARFDEIASARPPRLANAAARVLDALVARWSSRDWPGYAQLFAAGFHYSDRRPLVRLELDLDRYMAFVRQVGDMAISRYALDVIATRGERLALTRSRNEAAEGDVGPSEIESLVLFEIGEDGALCNAVRFALDDLDAAYAELDARWAAGEAAIHPSASAWVAEWRRGFAARDWQAMAALTAPDQVAQNHRLLGWGTMSGPGAWVRALEALVELAPDTRLRVDHLRTCARGFLWTSLWHGTRDGGAFETPSIMFVELDAHGKEIRVDVWDIEQIDEAYERFESLRATTPGWTAATDAQSNAASVAMERWRAAFDTAFASGDWEPMRALCAPEMLFDDHRRLALLSGDRELMIASACERVATGARPEISPIGTAGERVAAVRVLWGGGPPGGRFEIEYLCVAEVDADGLISAIILIDTADAREVRRKAWARWAAIDPVAAPWLGLLSELTDAWNAHDRERVRARFADDVMVEDHRHAGLGRIEGVDAYVESFDALWDLAPEQWVEFGWSWAAVDRHGIVLPLRRAGTLADGGAFESDYLWLGLAAGGRITRLELFEVDALDEALARFAELARA